MNEVSYIVSFDRDFDEIKKSYLKLEFSYDLR